MHVIEEDKPAEAGVWLTPTDLLVAPIAHPPSG